MSDPQHNAPTGTGTVRQSLFGAVAFPGDAFCEAFSAPATPREHWQSLIAALDATGFDMLRRRQERVRSMRHEDGATYNLFDDATSRGTSWALDMIPLPMAAGEWAGLEAGLIQRAQLLERILADVYGPQELLKTGRIPPELLFANPNFLRSCHGIQPSGNRYLTYYAADLYRAPDGRFRVLRDYGDNPAGIGYALENRIVLSRVFSRLYHKTQVRRLAPFFNTFYHSLLQRAALRLEDPGIVLLSPGPESQVYFEQALLSRYLGCPLVEGQDLTVRNGEVFLKKLAGLEPVAAIWRHVDDAGSDPFSLRRQAATGVAGLIQVLREGNLDIVNPVGSGFVDTPALAVFLPELCRQLLGANLLLENHPAWWCGAEPGRRHALAHLNQLDLLPAMDRRPPTPWGADPAAVIQAAPHAFMAREPIRPAAVPAWDPGGIQARCTLLRVFACATEEGFAVMPGGLAVTAGDAATLTGDCPECQHSKDIWVLSEQPVEPFSLLSGLRKVAEFTRASDLPSRAADHLLWLGRYLERAEGLIRLLRSVFRRLAGEARPADIPELLFLLNLLRAENIMPKVEDGPAIPRFRELSTALDAALYQKDKPESVVTVLGQVQAAARHVRDRLSLDSWHALNRLEDFADHQGSDPLEVLNDTLFALSAFSGLAMESMTRGLGWCFMDMGRRLERATNQVALMRIGLPLVCSESRSTLEALLEVSDSIMTYRARYRTAFQLAPAMDLLLVDESNPKSLAFQISRLAAHVDHLPRRSERRYASPEERTVLEMLTAARLLDLTGLSCSQGGIGNTPLSAFLESMEKRLKAFGRQITAHYLTRIPSTPHFATLRGKRL
jgi:uncharacterized circularly permuted ATP-grasp superfamily protein/uncharacterized alpha-E superfamily protein